MNNVEQQEMEKVLRELAALTPMEYDSVREEKRKALGVRIGTLDSEVAKRRTVAAEAQAEEVVEELSPWEEPVSGDDLLHEIKRQVEAHTVMQSGCSTAAAVWALGSFCLDAFRLFPKLHIKSPEKRCGKTTLMECLEGATCRPLMTSNITPAALFRSIEAWSPTLLIDEADTFARDNDELNGIINAGHTKRTAFVIRTVKVNEELMPRKFSVWGAQVIAGIKSQRDTLEDRSITIEMRRKMPSETVQKIPFDYYERNQPLRRQCLRWAEDHVERLKRTVATVPPCGNDRAQDNWEPLFAIAEVVGGEWPELVQSAYQQIEAHEPEESAAAMLLGDIQQIFDEQSRDRIHSEAIVSALVALDDRPWCEWKHGYPMTKASLSKLLKPYKIKSRQLKIAGTNLNGYEKADFLDAFKRYLPSGTPFQNSTSLLPNTGAGFDGFVTLPEKNKVEAKNSPKPSNGAGSRVVEFQKGGNRREGGIPLE